MRNLAGVADCDAHIRRELERARIEVVEGQKARGEVPYTVTGRLGTIELRRAWYYWIAVGQVPLDVALELYADPVGKTDVRVDGHCGCPPPEHPWIECYDAEGKILAVDPIGKERDQFRRMIDLGHLSQGQLDSYHWVDSAEERDRITVRAVVESYHIDTEVGLRVFADAVRKLVQP